MKTSDDTVTTVVRNPCPKTPWATFPPIMVFSGVSTGGLRESLHPSREPHESIDTKMAFTPVCTQSDLMACFPFVASLYPNVGIEQSAWQTR